MSSPSPSARGRELGCGPVIRFRLVALSLVLALIALPGVACGAVVAPTATATPVRDLNEFLAEVEDRVLELRGIPRPEPVPYRFLDREEMGAYLAEQFDDPEALTDIAQAEDLFKLLGLIPQDAVLLDIYLELLSSQVLGVYDPDKKEFFVLQSSEFGALEEMTFAHEYVHRLQDALFGLEDRDDEGPDNDDASLAFTALVEGDASAVQQIYTLRHMDFAALAEVLREAEEAARAAASAPYVLRQTLEFPYTSGLTFVNRLTREGGFARVDSAFEDPPTSTEQILHPEKYLAREEPVAVELPAGLFGEGWEVTEENTFGEFFLKTWLEAIGIAPRDSIASAEGWGGDRYAVAEDESGRRALAAMVAWDDPQSDAAEFFNALARALTGSIVFERIDTGPDVGIRVFNGPGGVLALGNLVTAEHGNVTVVTVAPTHEMAMELLLAMVI